MMKISLGFEEIVAIYSSFRTSLRGPTQASGGVHHSSLSLVIRPEFAYS
jgi:hypothetical protein